MTRSITPIMLQRSQSGFPLSVGTGLALETLMRPTQEVLDPGRSVPSKPDDVSYTNYLFNVSTLARNVITSVPYADLVRCSTADVVDTLLEEMDYLKTLFQMQDMNLSFYINSYSYAKSTYPDKLRKATTQQQLHSFDLTEKCVKAAASTFPTLKFSKDIHIDKSSVTLVLTHVPWDLLSYGRFRRLDLLESHTGAIKTRKQFNTKYYKLGDKDMSFLPFMEYLLVTFGDTIMFKPAPLKDRQSLYDTLLKKKVHPLMTELGMLR